MSVTIPFAGLDMRALTVDQMLARPSPVVQNQQLVSRRSARFASQSISATPSASAAVVAEPALRYAGDANQSAGSASPAIASPPEPTGNGRSALHLDHRGSPGQLWQTIKAEARRDAEAEPVLASHLHMTILAQKSFAKSMAFTLANKLSSPTLLGTQLTRLISDAYSDDETILQACIADILAVLDRDPACDSVIQCMLNFKGFQALQCYRIAHWLWQSGRKTLALMIQSQVSGVFHVDIHPAAQVGQGVLLDHATGVVIGETAVVGDNVSMLHHVTLGGSGTGSGIRHPHIGHGVLIGAGVSVLGNVFVGYDSKIGAGSVVVTDLPPQCVAVGVPARVIKQKCDREPSMDMDQCTDFLLDYQI
ncbi:hypothetical protein WJX84_006529 [Apatococcus fuscideae]